MQWAVAFLLWALASIRGFGRTLDRKSSGKTLRFGVPLFVGKEEEGTTIVKLESRRTSAWYGCEFKRTTNGEGSSGNAARQRQQQRSSVAMGGAFGGGLHRDVSSVLAKLSGICIRKTIDYWKYELCFDNKLTQSHGRDSFTLGTYSGLEGASQLYDDGSPCQENNPSGLRSGRVVSPPGGAQSTREARVEFVCDSSLRLVSVAEVSTCSYKVHVTTPLVCGHPDFLQGVRSIPGPGGSQALQAVLPPKDEWYLEIAETAGGQVYCQASALDPDSGLRFQDFELVLSRNSVGGELKPELDICRAKGRRALSKADGHYALRRGGEKGSGWVALASARMFNGELTHIFVQAMGV